MLRATWINAIASITLASACATTPTIPATNQQLVESRTSVRLAEEMGAHENPQAQLYLTLAREQIARADRLIRQGESWRARRELESAQANAELATVLARGSRARAEAVATRHQIDALDNRVP
jgi:hypothetical protein